MAKEKKMILEQNKKELTFYYELIGVTTILLSLIALARLGIVGYYVMMTFRIVFGDWYFAFLLALLLFGIYCLFKHQPLSLLNMRSVGVILLMIALLTFAHFPMHKYVSQFGVSHLKMTFNLYLDYFKNYQEGMVVGGGIIGMLFFYLFYSLFSEVGTIVIVIFISVVGMSFSFNKTIGETIGIGKKIMVKIWKSLKNIKNTIKYGIKVNENQDKKEQDKKKDKRIKFSIDSLSEPVRQNFIITEERHAVGLKKLLGNILNNMNVFYQDITYVISEHVTTFKVETVVNINLDKLYMKLKAVLTERFLITKDIDSPRIKIEIDNIDSNSPYLKTIMLMQKNYLNNLCLPIGIDTNNELVEINFLEINNVLIVEENIDLIIRMYLGYIMMLKIKLFKINNNFTILDINKKYKELEKCKYYHQDIKKKLEEIKDDIEKRLDLLNNNNCQDIFEYNRKVKENLSIEFIFVFNLENVIKQKEEFNLLLYLLQVGKNCGYYFMVHYFAEEILQSSIDSLFGLKILGKNSLNIAEHYIGINPINYLYDDEAFYLYQDELFRFSLAICTEEEKGKIINC